MHSINSRARRAVRAAETQDIAFDYGADRAQQDGGDEYELNGQRDPWNSQDGSVGLRSFTNWSSILGPTTQAGPGNGWADGRNFHGGSYQQQLDSMVNQPAAMENPTHEARTQNTYGISPTPFEPPTPQEEVGCSSLDGDAKPPLLDIDDEYPAQAQQGADEYTDLEQFEPSSHHVSWMQTDLEELGSEFGAIVNNMTGEAFAMLDDPALSNRGHTTSTAPPYSGTFGGNHGSQTDTTTGFTGLANDPQIQQTALEQPRIQAQGNPTTNHYAWYNDSNNSLLHPYLADSGHCPEQDTDSNRARAVTQSDQAGPSFVSSTHPVHSHHGSKRPAEEGIDISSGASQKRLAMRPRTGAPQPGSSDHSVQAHPSCDHSECDSVLRPGAGSVEVVGSESVRYRCTYCTVDFKSKKAVSRHVREQHWSLTMRLCVTCSGLVEYRPKSVPCLPNLADAEQAEGPAWRCLHCLQRWNVCVRLYTREILAHFEEKHRHAVSSFCTYWVRRAEMKHGHFADWDDEGHRLQRAWLKKNKREYLTVRDPSFNIIRNCPFCDDPIHGLAHVANTQDAFRRSHRDRQMGYMASFSAQMRAFLRHPKAVSYWEFILKQVRGSLGDMHLLSWDPEGEWPSKMLQGFLHLALHRPECPTHWQTPGPCVECAQDHPNWTPAPDALPTIMLVQVAARLCLPDADLHYNAESLSDAADRLQMLQGI